ncbi:hypothetical protein IF157_25375, partial [Salmonella enterica subsp. enterica serovar Typhimurium]|nr:hypothetical protein [Salmonella enterica subsp. enterica serovar Typhimurium]
ENTVASQEVSVNAAESALKVLESFRNDWSRHYEQYGKHWAGLLDQRELALLMLENADAALKQAEQTLRDEKRDVQVRLNNAQQQKIQAEKAYDKVSLFVEKEWAKRETAIMKLEQLAAQIQRSKNTLCTQRERLERLSELEKNKRSEKTLLNIQIGSWSNLCNEPFYSEITATEGMEGRSPEYAHEMAAQAHKKLLEAANGDQVTVLKQQL